MRSMTIAIEKRGNISVIFVTGEIGSVSAPVFEQRVLEIINEGATTVIVDLGKLEYITSAGLLSLLLIDDMLKEKRGKLFLTGLRTFVREVFNLSQLLSMFTLFESVEEALMAADKTSVRKQLRRA